MWSLEKASRGEKRNQRLTLQSELKLLHTTLKRQNDELSNLQATVKSSKRTFSQLIHSDLINSNKHKYISQSVNGREVINWLQLNTDSKMCGGKVPGPNQTLQDIIAQHDTQEQQIDINLKADKTNKQVKQLWAKKGVVFPGGGPIDCHEGEERVSAISIPIPSTTEEGVLQDHFPMSVNPQPVMVHPCSSSYPQFEQTGLYGQNNSGTPVAFPYFFNPHIYPLVPTRFNMPMEPQIYHNYNPKYVPNMPLVQTFSRETFSTVYDPQKDPHNVEQHMAREKELTEESSAKTRPVEVNENPLDILANAVTGM